MKIQIRQDPKPWNTSFVSMVREANGTQNHDIKFVSKSSEADVFYIEWTDDSSLHVEKDKLYLIYMEHLENFDAIPKDCPNVIIISESKEILDAAKDFGVKYYHWKRPTRVPKDMWYNGYNPPKRKDAFSMVSNASRQEDNITEVVKTYFAMCLYETEDGEMLSNFDLDVFSAQDIPFEPFNTLMFHGLQPNPLMFKTISKSKLFISPYRGEGVSINIIDAMYLGIPVLIRDTKANREAFFRLDDDSFYATDKELAKRIKWFKEASDKEIEKIAQTNFDSLGEYYEGWNAYSSLRKLEKIIKKEGF